MEKAKQRLGQLCSKKRTRAAQSQSDWKDAQELCQQHKLKFCRACTNVLPFTSFHKDKAGFCDLRDCCSSCYCKRQRELRDGATRVISTAIAERVASALTATGRKASDYETEEWSCRLLGELDGIDLRFWQDGTSSDAGVRPIGNTQDLWLPLQVKATRATVPPFTFNSCDKYANNVELVGVIGTGEFLVLCSDDAFSNGQIKKNHRADVVTSGALSHYLNGCWDLQLANGTLQSERVLRTQCSDSSLIEFEMMRLSSLIVDNTSVAYPTIRNSSVDRLLNDGTRVQDKAASWFTKQYTYKARLCKKFVGAMIPYKNTDCDLFVFSTVHAGLSTFFEWRIPSTWLSDMGYLTIEKEGQVIAVGKVTHISLGLPEKLQLAVFGSVTRSPSAKATEQFFVEHQLPVGESVVGCLRGRDPVRV